MHKATYRFLQRLVEQGRKLTGLARPKRQGSPGRSERGRPDAVAELCCRFSVRRLDASGSAELAIATRPGAAVQASRNPVRRRRILSEPEPIYAA